LIYVEGVIVLGTGQMVGIILLMVPLVEMVVMLELRGFPRVGLLVVEIVLRVLLGGVEVVVREEI
jgi:hypothetical protein